MPRVVKRRSHKATKNTESQDEPAAFNITPAWIDAAGRTRTWMLCDPKSRKVAEITTKRDAQKLADLLNEVVRLYLIPSP